MKKFIKIILIYKDYIQLKKENEKLREIDPVSIKEDIENNKIILDDLVKSNKELQAKIKEIKEIKNNPQPKEPEIKIEKKEIILEDKKEETKKTDTEDKKVEEKKIEEKKEEKKTEDKKEEKEIKKDKMQAKSELFL